MAVHALPLSHCEVESAFLPLESELGLRSWLAKRGNRNDCLLLQMGLQRPCGPTCVNSLNMDLGPTS